MDIQKWLNETVLPKQPPSPPDQRSLPPLSEAGETEQAHRGKRRRKRSMSDSSLLDIRPRRKKTPPAEDAADVEGSACSEAFHPASQSSGSSKLSQKYARRPRHKTRPERYEPAAKEGKERGTHTHRRRKGESKKAKRKAKSRKAEKPGTSIVQSFHAKNVPSDRLTLKPQDKLGIFNKGRASSPVKGRGLPDLVFSEMRFLRKREGQPEAMPQTGLSKQRLQKKDHAHAREEDISAYFSTVRPALGEQDGNIKAKEVPREKNLTQEIDLGRDISPEVDNAMPTIEMPGNAPYLDFGSRGPRHESGSYVSWSESIRSPSVTPMIRRTESAIDVGRIREGRDTNGADMSHFPPVISHTKAGSSRRLDMYSRVPIKHRISRSRSLPEHISPPRHTNVIDRVRKTGTTETAASPSSMPMSMPHPAVSVEKGRRLTQVDGTLHPIPRLGPARKSKLMRLKRGLVETETDGKERNDADPPTSSSLEKILQDCTTAFNEAGRVAASYEPSSFAIAPPTRALIQSGLNNFGSHRAPQTILPSSFGLDTYERQEQQQRYMQQPEFDNYRLIHEPYDGEMDGLGEEGEINCDIPEWAAALPNEMQSHVYEPGGFEESLARPFEMDYEGEMVEQSEDVVARGFWRPHKLY